MAEEQARTPEDKPHRGEGASDRFKRLAAADESQPEEQNLSDTQPSRPVKLNPSDNAETVFPAAEVGDWTPAPPPLGHTPAGARPSTDDSGMPLPRRVTETDPGATQVTGAAYSPTARNRKPRPGGKQKQAAGGGRWSRFRERIGNLGCLPRVFIYGAFAAILLAIAGTAFALYEYYAIASTLPDINDLQAQASQFETTRILDSEGNLLYEILDPSAGRRTYVPLENISPYLIAATIATEDEAFYTHPGFNPVAIVRAFTQNYASGEVVSGASTITQQLARILLFSTEEASDRSYIRKVREAILAAEITRRYTKNEILELYLNEIYFGNLAYGVEAAAQTYFGTTAGQLTLMQASFIAGLPQSPSVYDIYTNRDITLQRQQNVLRLMYTLSDQQDCIFVSNSPQRVCVSLEEAAAAALETLEYQFNSPDVVIRYPHWVNYIRSLLEAQFDPQTIYRSGFTVYTTLDPDLQDMAQDTLSTHVAGLADRNVGSGALVAIRPADGHILAMVGSADYNNAVDGQINMAVSPRQPGSSIKPLTYVAAFEKGWTASTLIWDVESEFPPSGDPNDAREPYIPENYDERHHGPVTVRTALANSYNIPAVKTLNFVGVYDNPNTQEPEGLVAFAHRMGITDLNSDQYGLALTLGGGEVKLLDLTNAYAIFANLGQRVTPTAITKIVDFQGNVVFEEATPSLEQVIRPEHAFLITSILSDNQARTPSFGANSLLNLPFPVAAKTGTTDDFRDNWTIGFTPDIAIGVWVGNPDNTEMQGTSGLTGAAPIWSEFMQEAIQHLTGGNPSAFARPDGIVEKVICVISGAEPSQYCPGERVEFFAADQLPPDPDEDLWQDVRFDTWTGLRASPECNKFTEDEFGLNVSDPWAVKWITQTDQGRDWAEDVGFDDPIFFTPQVRCTANDPQPTLEFVSPGDESHHNTHNLDIVVRASATADFDEYVLEWAEGRNPGNRDWEELTSDDDQAENPETIYTIDMDDMPRGAISLRLTMYSERGGYAEVLLIIHNDLPAPTAVPTSTPLPTLTPSLTPTPTETSVPPTNTPVPTDTETPSPTP
jgi:penicillin-binding protein 1C